MEEKWLSFVKRVLALSSTGIEFTKSEYDLDRYKELQCLATQMLATIANTEIKKIESLMLGDINGYETPKIDIRAAIIQDGKILLVKEKTDGRWALPGGYADVGLSAAENAVKEVQEEAGITVKTTKLYSVRHKAKGEYPSDMRDFYKLFFLCEQVCDNAVLAGSEALDADFFALNALPELSLGRVVKSDLEAAFNYTHNPDQPIFYDVE